MPCLVKLTAEQVAGAKTTHYWNACTNAAKGTKIKFLVAPLLQEMTGMNFVFSAALPVTETIMDPLGNCLKWLRCQKNGTTAMLGSHWPRSATGDKLSIGKSLHRASKFWHRLQQVIKAVCAYQRVHHATILWVRLARWIPWQFHKSLCSSWLSRSLRGTESSMTSCWSHDSSNRQSIWKDHAYFLPLPNAKEGPMHATRLQERSCLVLPCWSCRSCFTIHRCYR